MILLYLSGAALIGAALVFTRNGVLQRILSALFLIVQTGLCVYAVQHLGKENALYFTFDPLGVLLCLVLTILSFPTFYHSFLYLNRHTVNKPNQRFYLAGLTLLIATMTGAYFSNHLGVMWVFIEATTLFVSVLIYHERTTLALEATWKYIFICSVGLSISFMGILFLSTGTTQGGLTDLKIIDLVALAQNLDSRWIKITFLLGVTGFSAKMGLFPLHTVCIDAQTAAPSPVSAFISTTLMNVGFLGIFRLYTIVTQTEVCAWASRVLLIAGILSIAISAVQLLKVKHFKRMFAFSSLEHMGLIALGLAAGGVGYYAAILHVVLHSFTKASLFYQIGQVRTIYNSYWVKDNGNYMKVNPAGAFVLILAFIGISAIPPSGLFISEFLIFQSLFVGNHIGVAIATMFFLTIILFVFGKNLLRLLYGQGDEFLAPQLVRVKRSETFSQFGLLGMVILLCFYRPPFLNEMIQEAIAILK